MSGPVTAIDAAPAIADCSHPARHVWRSSTAVMSRSADPGSTRLSPQRPLDHRRVVLCRPHGPPRTSPTTAAWTSDLIHTWGCRRSPGLIGGPVLHRDSVGSQQVTKPGEPWVQGSAVVLVAARSLPSQVVAWARMWGSIPCPPGCQRSSTAAPRSMNCSARRWACSGGAMGSARPAARNGTVAWREGVARHDQAHAPQLPCSSGPSAEIGVRRLPVSAGGDHACGALVLVLGTLLTGK